MSRFALYRRIGHRTVRGWLDPRVLDLLKALSAAQAARSIAGGMAEIGVHHGRSFIGLHLLRGPTEKSLAIDLFTDQNMNIDESGRGDEATLRRNMVRHTGSFDDVIVLPANSLHINGDDVRKHLGAPARFFSVDGGHTCEIVQHDMQTAQDSLAEGGVVIADDVFDDSWPGVGEGTFRYLDQPSSLVPFAIGFNKVLLTQRAYADEYRRVIADVAEAKHLPHKPSVMHGEPVEIFVRLPLLSFRDTSTVREWLKRFPVLTRAYHFVRRDGAQHR